LGSAANLVYHFVRHPAEEDTRGPRVLQGWSRPKANTAQLVVRYP
jgi:hypothetical protein